MKDFAIIKTGGKQYRVAVGDKLEVELLDAPGTEYTTQKEVSFETLMVTKDGKITLGKPTVKTSVTGVIVEETQGDKIHIRKFKAKSRYRRHTGHRQKYSLVEIKSI